MNSEGYVNGLNLENYKIVVMCGLPGSGKSYWGKKWARELGARYVSSDAVRMRKVYRDGMGKYMNSAEMYLRSRELTYELMHREMVRSLRDGGKVVLDATYLGPQWLKLREILRERELMSQSLVVVVRVSEGVVKARVKQKQLQLRDRKYVEGWTRAYYWFTKRLISGELRYPSEAEDGVRVVEWWNE